MKQSSKINIIIVGAGKAGSLLHDNLRADKTSPFEVVGFVDDDKEKQGKRIKGTKVLGTTDDLKKLVTEHAVEELLIAVPSGRGSVIRSIIDKTAGLKLIYKILPRASEVLLKRFDEDFLSHIRKVRAEDLLGGEIRKSDQKGIKQYIRGKVVLITGAAGSIGSELSRQIAAYGAKKVIFYDWWERGMFDLQNELLEASPGGDFDFVIGDVKDRKKLNQLLRLHKPDLVFHAAAYKHVPLMEMNPAEAVKNNIVGTKTAAELSIKHGVKKFILVSTDKAVNPTNIMGATKRAAEQAIHILAQSQKDTTFCAVRFGNVINSSGSAIPTFMKQIAKGGPVTVTHREITRFFMTIPEAVHLILQTCIIGENDDLFVLDMGEPVKIYDLARTLIALEGYEPDTEIKISIIGLRPGEKLYEEVLVKQEETASTPINKVFRTKNYMNFDKLAFLHHLSLLLEQIEEDTFDIQALKARLLAMVPTYAPRESD